MSNILAIDKYITMISLQFRISLKSHGLFEHNSETLFMLGVTIASRSSVVESLSLSLKCGA